MTSRNLAIIVPVLNEVNAIHDLINHLKPYAERGNEVLFVDGGSRDGTAAAILSAGGKVITSAAGRAKQMNAGARATSSQYLAFLHADTRLPSNADHIMVALLSQKTLAWGRFDVKIEGQSRLLPIIAFMMNWRSRLTHIATGDQVLFMSRSLFEIVGCFPDQPLMEDIEISKQLKQCAPPYCVKHKVTTSGRRWDSRGSWKTIALMWKLRWSYWRGESPETLAEQYR
ncbi:TIGR04283 family arsenosugar biosynthesis glycosyltransferase [Neptunomonas phycophila]|uniref:TIGR04283 family arsenosugar biosynthesis glycosyltransferase n=1 Tax=Neptunomonas phycophila TaxID=1572645 RepID=UPI00094914CC|nr:TIGR04283 family arsenosugar biosynthesis glycosyltransferase [Neptunomonas phycophila]